MLNCIEIQKLDDFFIDLDKRTQQGVYFYRINGFNEQIKEFLMNYYQVARNTGVVIEGNIPNPNEKNLCYYEEIMGMEFILDMQFINTSLEKWLPRMNDYQKNTISSAMFDTLSKLKESGKNESMLKNAYIKFMCWLYYRFERIILNLGKNCVPKILYEGNISNYELLLLQILSKAGCDIILVQYNGDEKYLQLDVASELSKELKIENMTAFPQNFDLKYIRNEIQTAFNNERLYGIKPTISNCTNAWIEGTGLANIVANLQLRGNDGRFFYNAFIRMNGVEDKANYINELYHFYLELKNNKRRVVIIDDALMPPTMEEISQIKRNKYEKYEQLIMDLQSNIKYTANIELQRIMIKGFVDVILEESKKAGMNVNKITNKAVYILCWLKRYQEQLFSNWKQTEIACFIYFGACKSDNEALFLRFLAKLPIDVVILNPNLNVQCMLSDRLLYEIHYQESLAVNKFPTVNTEIQIGTTAYHAERELDVLMYQDSGIYRNQQYRKATTINLQTMYEEIFILWKQEIKYRPNFSVNAECVNIPAIYAKVCGVKDGNLMNYWLDIKKLITKEVLLIDKTPYISSVDANPMKVFSTDFLKNGKLQRNKIKNHAKYPYGVLREEIQEHILDKLQLLMDRKVIKGTFENGTEYTIVATVLNMNKEIVRMIQKFDFTKVNPKIIYINVMEESISLEDTILTTFLNLLGFDIVFFVPTGYQTVERYFNRKVMVEHEIGEYMYDLNIPNFNTFLQTQHISWKDKIFRRGI